MCVTFSACWHSHCITLHAHNSESLSSQPTSETLRDFAGALRRSAGWLYSKTRNRVRIMLSLVEILYCHLFDLNPVLRSNGAYCLFVGFNLILAPFSFRLGLQPEGTMVFTTCQHGWIPNVLFLLDIGTTVADSYAYTSCATWKEYQ